jgi:hypothetical protein
VVVSALRFAGFHRSELLADIAVGEGMFSVARLSAMAGIASN